jgi:hypothetical protein
VQYDEEREEGELLCGKSHFWICGMFPHITYYSIC